MPTVRQLKKATALRAAFNRLCERGAAGGCFKDDAACLHFWRAMAKARHELDALARNEGDERDGRNAVAWARIHIRQMATHAQEVCDV